MTTPKMTIIDFRPINKGALIAGFTILFDEWNGLTIKDCTLAGSKGEYWINFPQKEVNKDGKTRYYSSIYFTENNDEIKKTLCQLALKSGADHARSGQEETYQSRKKTDGTTLVQGDPSSLWDLDNV